MGLSTMDQLYIKLFILVNYLPTFNVRFINILLNEWDALTIIVTNIINNLMGCCKSIKMKSPLDERPSIRYNALSFLFLVFVFLDPKDGDPSHRQFDFSFISFWICLENCIWCMLNILSDFLTKKKTFCLTLTKKKFCLTICLSYMLEIFLPNFLKDFGLA